MISRPQFNDLQHTQQNAHSAKTRFFDQISAEHIEYMLSKAPRSRFVLVEEIASMVAWLVSEENSFTTGGVFDLSGSRAFDPFSLNFYK